MARLELENMEFYAFHGHFPEEQAVGGKYTVDLTIETDTTTVEKTDDLNDTIDYSEIYLVVKKEMETPSKLLEHLARRIIDSVKKSIGFADKITVKVSKISPFIGGKIGKFSVTLTE